MRTLINYLRSCFCKHEFEQVGHTEVYANEEDTMPRIRRKTYMCKKCGFSKQIKL